MTKYVVLLFAEFKKPIWNSSLQMTIAALLAYYLAMIMGPVVACGSGNSNISNSVFSCRSGDMSMVAAITIIAGMACGSLFLARAVSLLEKNWAKRVDN